MRIGLLYAMKGEIESMLTEETPLLQEKAGVSFYRIREDIIACCGGVGKVNAAMATQLFIDLVPPRPHDERRRGGQLRGPAHRHAGAAGSVHAA